MNPRNILASDSRSNQRCLWFSCWFLATSLVLGCNPVDRTQPIPSSQQSSLSTTVSGFVRQTFRDAGGSESKYIVFVPEAYDRSVEYPTILFLHGAGQTGSNGELQAQGGLGEAIRKRQSNFPFIAVFPQSRQGTWSSESPDGKRAIQVLEEVRKQYRVDAKRTYLTGYSMGGEGTWSLAAAHPEVFAAILPITPGKNPKSIETLSRIPCWCFQGAKDDSARVQSTRSMMLLLQQAGGRPMYHEYPDLEHDCWTETYQNDEVFEWLLQHSKH